MVNGQGITWYVKKTKGNRVNGLQEKIELNKA